jgi:hypothetical protein
MDTGTPQAQPTQKSQPPQLTTEEARRRRLIAIGVALIVILLVVALVAGIIVLLSPNTSTAFVGRIRDIFIIFMALESLLIGLALVILMIQLSRLINLLRNEVRPILDSTNETVNTLRGTTSFLSDNLVQPIIKLNEYLAGIQEMFKIFSLKKK